MAKGYYYSREQYLNNLDDQLRFQEVYNERMEGFPSIDKIKTLAVNNKGLDDLMGDEEVLKILAEVQLKKFMLAPDANKALNLLINKRQLSIFIRIVNGYRKSIGNPVLYSFNDFKDSWEDFAKANKTVIALSDRNIRNISALDTEEVILRNQIERDREEEYNEELPKKIEKIKSETESEIKSEQSKQRKEFKDNEEIKRSNITKEEKEKTDFYKKEIISKIGELDKSGYKGMSLLNMNKDKYNRLKSMRDDIKKYETATTKNYDITVPEMKKELNIYLKTPIIGRTSATTLLPQMSEIIKTYDELAEITRSHGSSTSSGSGLKKSRKTQKTRKNILKGEIRAGNNNPFIKKQLRLMN